MIETRFTRRRRAEVCTGKIFRPGLKAKSSAPTREKTGIVGHNTKNKFLARTLPGPARIKISPRQTLLLKKKWIFLNCYYSTIYFLNTHIYFVGNDCLRKQNLSKTNSYILYRKCHNLWKKNIIQGQQMMYQWSAYL